MPGPGSSHIIHAHNNSKADKILPIVEDESITLADAMNIGKAVGKEVAPPPLKDPAVSSIFDNTCPCNPEKAHPKLGEIKIAITKTKGSDSVPAGHDGKRCSEKGDPKTKRGNPRVDTKRLEIKSREIVNKQSHEARHPTTGPSPPRSRLL